MSTHPLEPELHEPELAPIAPSETLSEPLSEPSVEAFKSFTIVHQDSEFVVIDKPGGFHVHQPELAMRRVPREITVLYMLRRQIGEWLYPVHRLDVGTSGLLLMALNKEAASAMGQLFQGSSVEKGYKAIVRGYVPDEGVIDAQLALDSTGELVDARTEYRCLGRVELPHAVGKRHSSARYSLLDVSPRTGRFHQIRRHMARIAHPLVGDRSHGDSHHNRFFRETLGLGGLWLRADRLSFTDPRTGQRFEFRVPISPAWTKALDTLGFPQTILDTSSLGSNSNSVTDRH